MRTIVAGAAIAALSSVCSAASMEEWKSRSIYEVMIDRFAQTDGSTDAKCDELFLWCNGTWKGLINKLDYIQDMGFTAVKISPVVKNIEEDTAVGEAYHGYWSKDLYAVNEHFGTSDDLKQLSKELHDRDMFLMVDVVVNNMVQKFDNIVPPNVTYSDFNPFNNEEYFHPYCNVTKWDDPENYQDCWLYPYGVALADLKTESTQVIDMFGTWVKELVANYSIDGLRIDAAKHVNDAFLPQFVSNSGVFAFGEILTGVVEDLCRYQYLGLLPGMPNYLEYYPLLEAFNSGSFVDVANMRSEAKNSQYACNTTLTLGTFVENHDMPRFANKNPDMAIAKNAMTYVILNDGIPMVYQGQEQHFNGGETPQNREALWTSGYNTSAELYQLTATLNKARNAAIKATNASVSIAKRQSSTAQTYIEYEADTLFVNEQHLCLRKGPEGSQIVFCVVNHSSSGPKYDLSVGGFMAGDEVVNLLDCTTSTADGTGNVTMHMNHGEPKAYALRAMVESAGLCKSLKDESDSAAGLVGVNLRLGLGVVLGSVLALMAL